MDPPDRQFDALSVERLLPCKDMLIDAVYERAIEIKQENRLDTHDIPPTPEIRCRQAAGGCPMKCRRDYSQRLPPMWTRFERAQGRSIFPCSLKRGWSCRSNLAI